MESQPNAVADALFEAIAAKDIKSVAALYVDEIEVWHNFSNATQTKTDNLRVLEGLIGTVERLRYDVLERHMFGNRIVQRHNLRCSLPTGEEIVIPACIFITVVDGKITRIDEYLDTAQTRRLRTATSPTAAR